MQKRVLIIENDRDIRDLVENPANVRAKLWKRAFKIYGYHLLMLAFASMLTRARIRLQL